MDEKQIEKSIGYLVVVILAYHIVGLFVDFLVWAVISLVVLRVYLE